MLDEAVFREIEQAAGRAGVRGAPLGRLTAIGCGGPAAFMIEVDESGRLAELLRVAADRDTPWFVLGRGTNLLIADEGFEGVVIILSGNLRQCTRQGNRLTCGAGIPLPRAAVQAAEQGLSGLEPLAHIPGTLGGAVAMNAGAFGASIGDLVNEVEICLPGECRPADLPELDFGYRSCGLPPGSVVSRVVLELKPRNPGEIREAMLSYRSRRETTQPRGERTFGSVFKNPPDSSAGRLLEEAGCKKLSVGGAEVSDRHANFIVNKGNAGAADVVNLMNQCRRRVFDKFGVALDPEVRFLGNIGLEEI